MKNRTPHTSTREALQQSFAWVNCDHCRIHSVWQSSAILNSPAGRPWTRLGPDLPDPWTMEIWTINLVSIKLKATLMKLNDCLRCYSTGKAARAQGRINVIITYSSRFPFLRLGQRLLISFLSANPPDLFAAQRYRTRVVERKESDDEYSAKTPWLIIDVSWWINSWGG